MQPQKRAASQTQVKYATSNLQARKHANSIRLLRRKYAHSKSKPILALTFKQPNSKGITMTVTRFELTQMEGFRNKETGKMETIVANGITQEALDQLKALCAKADHYKSRYSIEFQNGDVYDGYILLSPDEDRHPLEWISTALISFAQDWQAPDTEAITLLHRHFPNEYQRLISANPLLAF